MKTSRRKFLKVAGLSAFALAGGMTALAGEAGAQVAPGKYIKREGMLSAKRWAMVIDRRGFTRTCGAHRGLQQGAQYPGHPGRPQRQVDLDGHL